MICARLKHMHATLSFLIPLYYMTTKPGRSWPPLHIPNSPSPKHKYTHIHAFILLKFNGAAAEFNIIVNKFPTKCQKMQGAIPNPDHHTPQPPPPPLIPPPLPPLHRPLPHLRLRQPPHPTPSILPMVFPTIHHQTHNSPLNPLNHQRLISNQRPNRQNNLYPITPTTTSFTHSLDFPLRFANLRRRRNRGQHRRGDRGIRIRRG